MIPEFKDCTLEQRQKYFYNASHCIYCRQETEYVSSLKVYQEYHGMIHLCPCGAYVGCLINSDQALGTTARKTLRNLRIECHEVYDPLIDAKVNQLGVKRKQAQADGRKWLSEYLGIAIEECHIGYFNEETCKTVIDKCRTFYPTPEEIEKRKRLLENQIEMIRDYSKEFSFELKEHSIMGVVQMSLSNEKKTLYLNLKKKEYRLSTKKKPSKIEDIEELIITHFKP